VNDISQKGVENLQCFVRNKKLEQVVVRQGLFFLPTSVHHHSKMETTPVMVSSFFPI